MVPETPPSPPAPSPDPAAVAPATDAPRRRGRRWPHALGLLGYLLIALALPAAAGWLLWSHPQALPRLLDLVPGLSLRDMRGTLREGHLEVAELRYDLPARIGRLEIDGLVLDGLQWQRAPHAGSWFALRWQRLSATQVRWISGPPTPGPIPAPPHLRSPVALLDSPVQVQRLAIDHWPVLGPLQARIALAAEHGTLHQVRGLQADTPWGRVLGQGDIATAAPMALQVALQAQGTAAAPGTAAGQAAAPPALQGWQGRLQAQGPLARFDVSADLQAQWRPPAAAPRPSATPTTPRAAPPTAAVDSRLHLRAGIAPFEAWPLAALQLDTQALDLAAWHPAAPHTLLDLQARIDTRGLHAPVGLSLVLDNRLPGRWDQQRLPLRQARLALRAPADRRDRLVLEQGTLSLADAQGDAGQIGLQGRWLGERLELALALQGLRPQSLVQQAPALLLSGPLTLQLQGLAFGAAPRPQAHLALQARLDGRLLERSAAPVQLVLDGEAGAEGLTLRELSARSGDAQASLSLSLLADGGPAGWRARLAQPLSRPWHLRSQGRLDGFEPQAWWRSDTLWPAGLTRLRGDWQVDLRWQGEAPGSTDTPAGMPDPEQLLRRALAGLQGDARLRLADSRLAGLPLAADASLRPQAGQLALDGSLSLAGNRIALQGQRGRQAAADRWRLQLAAPALAALGPLRDWAGGWVAGLAGEARGTLQAAWPRQGQAEATLALDGRWPAWSGQGHLALRDWASAAHTLQQLDADWQHGADADAPLKGQLALRQLAVGELRLERLTAQLDGSLRQHQLGLSAEHGARLPAALGSWLGAPGSGTRLQLQAQGRWAAQAAGAWRWRWQDGRLRLGAREAPAGTPDWAQADALAGELQVDADGALQTLQAQAGRLQLPHGALRWQPVSWQAGHGGAASVLNLAAEIEPIDAAQLLARLQPGFGWAGDLRLGGRIELRLDEHVQADLVFERLGGDLQLIDDLGATQALGITDLRLALTGRDGSWQFAQGLAGRSLGDIVGAQVLRLQPGQRFPDADSALQGVVQARVASLAIWGTWVPPGWRLGGQLDTVAQIGGRLGAPELRGELRGRQIAVRNLLQGVNMTEGELAVTLDGDRAQIQQATIRGGDGTLSASGQALLGAKPSLDLQFKAERFRALGRVDRRVIASGQAQLALDAARLKLSGRIGIDEGQIDFSQKDAPSLDGDVQVRRQAPRPIDRLEAAGSPTPAGASSRSAQIDLVLDLGSKLRLRGRGVDHLTLRGELAVGVQAGRLQLNGTVQGEGGTYAAYGQNLAISRCDLTFSGAPDNPRLDVRATRPNLDVVVGVSITGSAQMPRVRLFSEPELGEYEKLSWLVLGRSPDGLGRADTALLQRAALALLTDDGRAPTDDLMQALGITDFSVRQTEGTVRDTVVSLGRQLSERWYLGYERSVNATTGTWQLVYRVAQRFTLRAQSGSDNAVDAIWSWRW